MPITPIIGLKAILFERGYNRDDKDEPARDVNEGVLPVSCLSNLSSPLKLKEKGGIL